ncbi:MAG: glycoside hydrolase family 75 protein [Verrucomicrobiales bacterium]
MSEIPPESQDENRRETPAGETLSASPFSSQPAVSGTAVYSWRPPPRRGILGKLLLLIILGGLFALPFTGAGRRIKEGTIEVIEATKKARIVQQVVEREKEKIVYRDPPPPPLPQKFVPQKQVNVAELWNGIQLKTEVHTEPGDVASKERKVPEAFVVKFSVDLRVPKPNSTLDDLARLNADLPKALPGLAAMLPRANVSGFYHELYQRKQKLVEQNLLRLDKLLTRHNFFDCETVLEMRHPESGQRVLLIQGEMDVVSDGSDGDRMSDFDDYIAKSDHFQPTTSYAWPKQTPNPNPLMARFESRATELKKKLAAASNAQKKEIQAGIAHCQAVIRDLGARSFLIAQEDPFVVIPTSMKRYVGVEEYAPQIGDYAVVAHGSRLLPAIVGDYGPGHITGEGSLRIAKEINERATPFARPESDLEVSYFIFPGSAEKPFAAPDYDKWHQRCAELLARIGGVGEGYRLHKWEDRLKKKKEEEAAALAKAAAEKAAAEKAAANKNATPQAASAQPPAAEAGDLKPN